MSGTYSQILLHIVCSTKHRKPWITADIAERLYPYMGGIVRAAKGVLHDIGGVEDHVHLYLRWRPDESVSALMRTVKGGWPGLAARVPCFSAVGKARSRYGKVFSPAAAARLPRPPLGEP